MATAARVALRPYNEATRPSPKGRVTGNFHNNSSTSVNTAISLQMQRLSALGIFGQRAVLTAALAWGEARNG